VLASAGVAIGIGVLAVLVITIIAPLVYIARGRTNVELTVDGGQLTVRLSGKDALLAFKRSITVALSDIAEVSTPVRKDVPRHGLRLPGTEIPGFIRAGSYDRGAKREFWDVRKGQTVLVIDMTRADPYVRLVLEVDDPAGKAQWLRSQLDRDV
jgi:hypothetical protein